MKKENFVNRKANEEFFKPEFQKSWKIHVQAFGPILEPAFADDYQTRIHLTSALNKLSRQDIKGGVKKLESIEDKCCTDADIAAWYFFMGLANELSGKTDDMVCCYRSSCSYGHSFYLPYLKLARHTHTAARFDDAEDFYRKGISCLEKTTLDPKSQIILASAYTNLASCLTMMHRYEDAKAALNTSAEVSPVRLGRSATEVILYATLGDKNNVNAALSDLEGQSPLMLPNALKMSSEILSGKHPQFAEVEVDDEKIKAFWTWFAKENEKLKNAPDNDIILHALGSQLKNVFPFMERDLSPMFSCMDGQSKITFTDFYAISLTSGFAKLINACPAEIAERWNFDVIH